MRVISFSTILKPIAILFLFMVFTGCNKVPGCMDQDAVNFNYLAEEDDGNQCSYMGGVVFYHEKEASDNFIAAGITNLKYYIDGVFHDNKPANTYFTYVPTCQSDYAFAIENYGMGMDKTLNFNYEIKDQNDQVILAGSYTMTGNNCTVIKIEY